MGMQCPDCGSGRRSDGYNRDGWYWLECDRRYNPETGEYSPENNWCRLKQRDAEHETLNTEFAQFRAYIRGMLPQASNPAVSDQWILDAISHVIREYETLKKATEALKPAWVCEFCFACLLEGDLPTDWDLVFLSAVCPSCQKKVAQDGGYGIVKGGAYSDGRRDPRTITPNLPQERK